jgi:DNA-binding NtrC family response regulator
MNPFSQLKKAKTLLVDDDELIRDSLSMAFATKGCFIKTAETAEEGLQALEEEKFDIIISDFRLPGINGLEFFKLANSSQPDTMNILITACRDKDLTSNASEIRVDELFEKPFSVTKLAEALVSLIKNNKEKSRKLL